MGNLVRAPKDFWTGLLYVAFGCVAVWIGQDYRFGTAGRMGPGYFPLTLAAILVGIGLLSLGRSFVVKGEGIARIVWKPLVLILLANALFGFLLPRAGIVVALFSLCIVSAAASKEFRFDWKATGGLLLLVAFCVVVFVKGLGVPMPIVGRWLQPYITASWLQ